LDRGIILKVIFLLSFVLVLVILEITYTQPQFTNISPDVEKLAVIGIILALLILLIGFIATDYRRRTDRK
jgi:glycerol uptake facilitator-like aquaporin